MDGTQRSSSKLVCLGNCLSFILVAAFFYYLMSDNTSNNSGISVLREEVNQLSRLVYSYPAATATGSSRNSKGDIGPPGAELTIWDSEMKHKVDVLMDDVKRLKEDCSQMNAKKKRNSYQNSCECPSQCQCPNKNRNGNQDPNAIYDQNSSQGSPVGYNRLNFASDDLGARIVTVTALPISRSSIMKSLLGLDFSANPPVNMLRPSLAPGSCFGYRGDHATVVIHLAKAIVVETITLTHAPKELLPSLGANAPKDFEVFGMPPDSSAQEPLGKFTYGNDANRRSESYQIDNKNTFRRLVFDFSSNHGGDFTCIYRVEVYGRLPTPDPEGTDQGEGCGRKDCQNKNCKHGKNHGKADLRGGADGVGQGDGVSRPEGFLGEGDDNVATLLVDTVYDNT